MIVTSIINYRYCNKNGTNHGYNVTAYAPVSVKLSNVTSQIDVNSKLHNACIDYCRKNITPTRKSNGLNIYSYKACTKEFPFMITAYQNTSSNYYKTSSEVSGQGGKSFCIYCDDYATEDDTKVVKPLPPNSITCVIILKYSLSSIFTCSSSIAGSSAQEAASIPKKKTNYNVPSSSNTTNTNNNQGTTNVVPSNSPSNNPVFQTEGEYIDEDGYLIQYLMQSNSTTYVIGLESRYHTGIKLAIILQGLDILDSAYKGKSNPTFVINPNEKKVFNVRIKSNYSGDVTFQFEYL